MKKGDLFIAITNSETHVFKWDGKKWIKLG